MQCCCEGEVLRPGFRLSRERGADVRFRGLPIDKSRRPVGDSLAALIEDVFVPGRGLNGVRSAGEIFPQRLHRRELLVETYILEEKVERHGASIPQRWMDSNTKLTANARPSRLRIAQVHF